jgi:serine/threonine protein kinase
VWDDYEADTELIGRGAFARVFRALKRDDGSPVAIKVIGRETKAFPQQRRGEQQQLKQTVQSPALRCVAAAQ